MKNSLSRRHFILGGSASALVTAGILSNATQAIASTTPQTIPSFQSWAPGPTPTTYRRTSRILVDPAASQELTGIAETLADDLLELAGIRPAILNLGRDQAQVSDVFLSLNLSPVDAKKIAGKDEGYKIEIGGFFAITALTATGSFYGSRSLLQLLAPGFTVPGGEIYDWPLFNERGLRIDNYSRTYSLDWWRNLLRDLSYLKLNVLQTGFLGGYALTSKELSDIKSAAKKYRVNLVANIPMSGHADPILDKHPELELFNAKGQRPITGRSIDYSKLQFDSAYGPNLMQSYLDQFIPETDGDYFHVSGDEFIVYPGWPNIDGQDVWAGYPQLAAFARDKCGPQALPADGFIWYLNWLNREVKARGKKMRIWNDSVDNTSVVKLDSDITIEFWYRPIRANGMGAVEAAKNNPALNVRDDLLYHDMGFRTANASAIYDSFSPLDFHPGVRIPAESAQNVTGAMIAVWMPDRGADYPIETNEELRQLLAPGLKSLAQKTWGFASQLSYANFSALNIGKAPGLVATQGRIAENATWFSTGNAALARTKTGTLEYFSSDSTGTWRGEEIAEDIMGKPATLVSANKLLFAIRGKNNDLILGSLDAGQWTLSRPLNNLSADPTLALDGDGNAAYFAITSGGELWSGTATSAAERLAENIAGPPTAVLDSAKTLFWFATDTTQTLRHGSRKPSEPWRLSPASLVTNVSGQPAVSQDATGKLTIFVRRSNGDILHRWQLGVGLDWNSAELVLVSDAISDPQVGLDFGGKQTLFARKRNGDIVHRWQESPASSWSPNVLTLLNGALAGPALISDAQKRLAILALDSGGNAIYRSQATPGGDWATAEKLYSALGTMPSPVLASSEVRYLAKTDANYLVRGDQNSISGTNRWSRWVMASS